MFGIETREGYIEVNQQTWTDTRESYPLGAETYRPTEHYL